MPLDKDEHLLRRKVAPRKPASVEASESTGPAATLVRAFARVLAASTPLVAEDASRHHKRASLAELLDLIEPDAFVITLSDGGLAVIDQSGFATLIEAMTVGRLSAREPQPRRATATDSTLLSGVIAATLAGLGPEDALQTARCERPVADHRLIGMLLEDGQFDLVALTARLACGAVFRPLRMMFARPLGTEGPAPGAPVSSAQPGTGGFEAAVLAAPALLRAELGRVTMPLAEVLDLGIGSTLYLPLSTIEDIQLVSLDGIVQASGRLGQSRGHRAVRLTRIPGASAVETAMTDATPAPPEAPP